MVKVVILRQRVPMLNLVRGGGAQTPAQPPFMSRSVPDGPIHEQGDLLWDDGTAPELTIDFDAQHISVGKGLAMWAAGMGFFFALYQLVIWSDPESKRYAAKPIKDEAIFRQSFGGHPDPQM